MLYRQTVNPELLELLNELMADELFSDFLLVGGTGLALQIGHRHSIDIDLFGKKDLEEIEMSEIPLIPLPFSRRIRGREPNNYLSPRLLFGNRIFTYISNSLFPLKRVGGKLPFRGYRELKTEKK